jgi:hypothetical protein
MNAHVRHTPCHDTGTGAAGVSSGKSAGAAPEKFFGQPFDLHHYRTVFPDVWMRFLHMHFRDHIHVAFMFSVNERTARNWWEGVGAPRPEAALIAVKHIPGAASFLLEAA